MNYESAGCRIHKIKYYLFLFLYLYFKEAYIVVLTYSILDQLSFHISEEGLYCGHLDGWIVTDVSILTDYKDSTPLQA